MQKRFKKSILLNKYSDLLKIFVISFLAAIIFSFHRPAIANKNYNSNINLKNLNKQNNTGQNTGRIDLNNKDYTRSTIFEPMKTTPNRLFSASLSKPTIFSTTNNLAKKTGSFYHAKGEIIQIKGKITDVFGVPISGAIIKIWQTNSAGKYQNLLENNSEFIDRNFNMSGIVVSNNLGDYNFNTIMPGSYLNRAPHINMDIYHSKFGTINTEVYFENHPRNKLDYQYLSYSKEEQNLLTAPVRLFNMFDKNSRKICMFDIIMEGVHQYKNFKNK
jgi:protocatechuate 3,4-dioxygenase, beta subunit